ncbi:glycosyltransferase family 1 protein [filamentous cyanobacterium CCP5]|nr:glycosyltransferase family 1 protein [filamentous cyanobacterium CCP5]
MRIAYICADPGVPVFGRKGCSIHLQEVIRALQNQGARVDLLAVRWGEECPADLRSIRHHRLPSVPQGEPAVRERIAFSMNPDIYTDLELTGPYDLIYERYSLWSYAAMEYAQAAGIPSILEVNAPLIEEQAQYRGLVHRDVAEEVAKRVFKAAQTVVAVSEPIREYLAPWGITSKVQVIPNGVNGDRFAQRPGRAISGDSDPFTVGFVGSLKPWHGLPHLVDAFHRLHQRVPQARLLIVGDGPQRPLLQRELDRRGLAPCTQMTGAVPPDQIPALLGAMDVAVAPYPHQENFYFSPLKVVEYMAAGLPVVVSAIGQLRHLIHHGETGLLCPPGDQAALALALEQLWRSPLQRQNLGQAARRYALTHFTWERIAQQILAIAQTQGDLPPQGRPCPAPIP